jgi:hypothetical protein
MLGNKNKLNSYTDVPYTEFHEITGVRTQFTADDLRNRAFK